MTQDSETIFKQPKPELGIAWPYLRRLNVAEGLATYPRAGRGRLSTAEFYVNAQDGLTGPADGIVLTGMS